MPLVIIKKLVESEVKWFKSAERRIGKSGGSQKGLSPTSLPFSQRFPSLNSGWEGRIDVSIFGPENGQLAVFSDRKLNKSNKNWRIQTDINDIPLGSPYRDIAPDDFAIIDFQGETEPTSATLYLVSQHNKLSHTTFMALQNIRAKLFPQSSSIAIEVIDLVEALTNAGVAPDTDLILGLSGSDTYSAAASTDTVNKQLARAVHHLSAERFYAQLARAQEVGQKGEEIVAAYLREQLESGNILHFEWISQDAPGSPHDFTVITKLEEKRFVEVKSSSSSDMTEFLISQAEISEASSLQTPYDIYRVFGVGADVSRIEIASDVGATLKSLLEKVEVPKELKPTAYRLSCSALEFEPIKQG